MMRRFLAPFAAMILIAGGGAYAFAQGATPAAGSSSAAICATAFAGTPIASPVASPLASPGASPVAGAGLCGDTAYAVEIDAVDMAFQPNEITVPANTPVLITLINKGIALHNFSVDALKLNEFLVPGGTTTIAVTLAPGDYPFYCDVPGHQAAGMIGTIHAK